MDNFIFYNDLVCFLKENRFFEQYPKYTLDNLNSILTSEIFSKTQSLDDEKKEAVAEVFLYTDGASRGNPGHAGAGFYLEDGEHRQLEEGFGYLGMATNNIAEYRALLLGLKAAFKYRPDRLHVFMDSELAVRQIRGEYKVKNEGIRIYYNQVLKQMEKFSSWDIQHIPRSRNQIADRLANTAIDER